MESPPNSFQDCPVMTTSVTLRIDNDEFKNSLHNSPFVVDDCSFDPKYDLSLSMSYIFYTQPSAIFCCLAHLRKEGWRLQGEETGAGDGS